MYTAYYNAIDLIHDMVILELVCGFWRLSAEPVWNVHMRALHKWYLHPVA